MQSSKEKRPGFVRQEDQCRLSLRERTSLRGAKGDHERRGAITLLVAAVIAMLLILAAFAINVAYMQFVRQQLRVASDSAAKAALIKYGATQSQSTATAFAQTVCANNLVAGHPLQLPTSNIVFGNATMGGNGVYSFTAGASPANAVQVTASVAPPLFLSNFLSTTNFKPQEVSLAARVSHDICLVLDRSASMAFDLSGVDLSYPADVISGHSPHQCYYLPPSQTASRWAALDAAVTSFVSTLQSRSLDVHVALVTFAETYSFGEYSATASSLDVPLTSTYGQITTEMNYWNSQALIGGTNIQAGLATAVSELTGPRARSTADRTIILFSDGVPTSGSTDIASLTASNRTNSQIVTHVVTFSPQAAPGTSFGTVMQNAATNGNGMYFNAPSAAQLTQAFQTIADSIPAVLIK